jgi:pimeloyl-ACP methyl ester carboxylesterase
MRKVLAFVAGLFLVGIGVVVFRYQRVIRAAHRRLASLGSQVIDTACGPVEYARVGQGSPVLVVHGAFGGFDQGLWVAESSGLANYQVISVSRFGFLGTPLPPQADLNLQADAFAALLDALGIRRVSVFAVSAGSTASIRFAARYPERVSALILFGPDAPGEHYMSMPPRSFFDKVLRSDFIYWALVSLFPEKVKAAIGLAPKGYTLNADQQAMLKKIQFGTLPVSRRMDGEIFSSYTDLPELFESVLPTSPYPLGQIKTPVLVLNAADDPISLPENVRALAEKMPNARLFVVPDGGHFFLGHDEEVKAEIARFLESHRA